MNQQGTIRVTVEYKGVKHELDLFVFEGNNSPILGRDWMEKLGILNKIRSSMGRIYFAKEIGSAEKEIKQEFKEIFSENVGLYKYGKFKLHLKEGAEPVFHKPGAVSYALKEGIEKELNRLVKEKILVPVESSEWATPIVPVLKNDGNIRICGDYKVTINPLIKIDRYPIPRVADLFAKIEGGKFFSKIDFPHAYQQVEIEPESQELLTINTL